MPRLARLVPLVALTLATLFAAEPAAAKQQLLHWKFQRALVANPLDSVLVTLTTTSFDTLEAFNNDNINATSVTALDTNTVAPVAAVAHIPIGSSALVFEVTGAMQSMDSIYVSVQFSEGPTAKSDGSTGNPAGDQNNPFNWRWFNALGPTGVLVNATGTQTFIFPIPCSIGGPNAYVWAKGMRGFVQGDTNAAAKGFSTRAWLVTRE